MGNVHCMTKATRGPKNGDNTYSKYYRLLENNGLDQNYTISRYTILNLRQLILPAWCDSVPVSTSISASATLKEEKSHELLFFFKSLFERQRTQQYLNITAEFTKEQDRYYLSTISYRIFVKNWKKKLLRFSIKSTKS